MIDRVLDEDGGAGGETAPGSQRASREGVPAARRGQRRRHLGHAQHQRQVHAGDDDRGDGQAAEAALPQAEVPPGVVAGDDVADTEAGQQHPTGGAGLQLPLLEIGFRLAVLFDAAPGAGGTTVATHGM